MKNNECVIFLLNWQTETIFIIVFGVDKGLIFEKNID